ncbi:hypothetical protein ASPZODRAFT_136878 [Penicilliopsis zonata CBS 506.65]|uniref:Secreted protein n=1 Tax=Penicilliopsis zonata CBS 506.65 TaxID=1073090 RepID=A0A1L9S772_9EURO|nr:hypothetical protein ASPZODRAFT_136878 [Penicilliopsis zonata CBS 506.65]OJJ42999.1 hypothetical protein ASPZODRAFT_136878 [Penicilliopsis zonata CBS 506.65]
MRTVVLLQLALLDWVQDSCRINGMPGLLNLPSGGLDGASLGGFDSVRGHTGARSPPRPALSSYHHNSHHQETIWSHQGTNGVSRVLPLS